jgi:arylsulfatase A-like enzyme
VRALSRAAVCVAAIGSIAALGFAGRQIAEQQYLPHGLWRTSLWTASHHALTGAVLGAAVGVLLMLSVFCWPVVLWGLQKLQGATDAPRPAALSASRALDLTLFFALCSGAALLVIPLRAPSRLGLPYILVLVGSFGALWLLVSRIGVGTIPALSEDRQPAAWFRLQWLTLIGLVYLSFLLSRWAGPAHRRLLVMSAAGGIVAAVPVCVLLSYPAQLIRDRVLRPLGRFGARLGARALPAVVLALTAALCIAGWIVQAQTTSAARHLGGNVIIVAVDTLRADRVSLLPAEDPPRDLTPNTRKFLGERATVYSNAISQAPWTLPAFASMFTGLYPEQHRAELIASKLEPEHVTLAELLREAGYRTMGVVSNCYVGSSFDMDQGFVDFDESQALDALAVTSRQVTDRALAFLRAHNEEPFFLFVHYFDPHGTYCDHPEFDFADDYTGWLQDEAQSAKQTYVLQVKRHLLGPAEHAYVADLYDEEVAYCDTHVGRLLAFLEDHNLWDSSLVVFVSDHGEEFFEHGSVSHRSTLYQELIRVPLAIAAPSRESPCAVARPVETRWLFGTVLDFVGLSPPPEAESCPSLLAEKPADADLMWSSTRPVLRAEDLGTDSGARVWLSTVVGERWKLIKDHIIGRIMLFDLLNDPGETRDLSADEPEIAGELEQTLDALEAELRGTRPAGPGPKPDEEQLRRLKALGYL